MFCVNCGNELISGANYCSSCGVSVGASGFKEAAQEASEESSEQVQNGRCGITPEIGHRAKKELTGGGVRWLTFWIYIFIPFVVVIQLLMIMGAYEESNMPVFWVNAVLLVLIVFTAIGLHLRRLQAYWFNWIFLIVPNLVGFTVGFLYGFDMAFKQAKLSTPEWLTSVLGISIFCGLFYANYAYWVKRKSLFSNP